MVARAVRRLGPRVVDWDANCYSVRLLCASCPFACVLACPLAKWPSGRNTLNPSGSSGGTIIACPLHDHTGLNFQCSHGPCPHYKACRLPPPPDTRFRPLITALGCARLCLQAQTPKCASTVTNASRSQLHQVRCPLSTPPFRQAACHVLQQRPCLTRLPSRATRAQSSHLSSADHTSHHNLHSEMSLVPAPSCPPRGAASQGALPLTPAAPLLLLTHLTPCPVAKAAPHHCA